MCARRQLLFVKLSESARARCSRLRHHLGAFAAAARTAAQRFFVASIMRRRPSGLRRRFAFLGAEATASDTAPFFTVAHLLRCASAICFLAVTLIVCRPFDGLTETDSEL